MTDFNWTTLSETTYKDQRWELIQDVEGFHGGTLYYDSRGYLSNGTGFNLTVESVRNEVIKGLGLNAEAYPDDATYITQITNILSGSAGHGDPNGDASGVQTSLNNIMAARKTHYDGLPEGSPKPPVIKPTFTFADANEARPVFDGVPNGIVGEYEDKVDQHIDNVPEFCRERLALLSLGYNQIDSNPLLGARLNAAIQEGGVSGRTKAWIEIRYLSNKDSMSVSPPADAEGIAKRRYYESEIFGLYGNGTFTTADSETAYTTMRSYGPTTGTWLTWEKMQEYDALTKYGDQIAEANGSDYPHHLATVKFLTGELASFAALLGHIDPTGNSEIDALYYTTVFNPLNIHIGDSSSIFGETLSIDLLEAGKIIGGGGSDLIYGNAFDDHLEGAVGNDTIYGNDGNDLMHGDFLKNVDNPFTAAQYTNTNMWGNDTLQGGAGRDQIVGDGGSDSISGGDGDDYLFGDWGTKGSDIEDAAMGADTIYGDLGDDTIYGDGNADQLHGGEGNDILSGDYPKIISTTLYNQGNDTLYGDAGSDLLFGDAGDDTLDGGDDMYRMCGMPKALTAFAGQALPRAHGCARAANDVLIGDSYIKEAAAEIAPAIFRHTPRPWGYSCNF